MGTSVGTVVLWVRVVLVVVAGFIEGNSRTFLTGKISAVYFWGTLVFVLVVDDSVGFDFI